MELRYGGEWGYGRKNEGCGCNEGKDGIGWAPEGKRGGYKISAWALEHGARRGGIGMGIGMRVRGGGKGGTESRSVSARRGRGEEGRARGDRLARR